MAVAIRVGAITDEIGTAAFLNAFFATVAGLLDPNWGTRFPVLLGELYQGRVAPERAAAALGELAVVRQELAGFAPDRVIWDLADRTQRPPWGDAIAAEITDLSNYFVTSAGRDLIGVLDEALQAARDEGRAAEIVPY